MILRLFFYLLLLFFTVPAVLLTGREVMRRLRPWRERRQLASRRARLLEEKLKERCVYCDKHTPSPQLYDDRTGWYHQSCYLSIVDDG